MSTLTQQICRDVVHRDAKAWHKRRYPRGFVRFATTEKTMPLADRKANDSIFAEQNREWDATLMDWYERTYVSYGGAIGDLPWNVNERRRRREDQGS